MNMPRSYHHPLAVSRNITSLGVKPFTTDDGVLYAVIDMGDGGSLWLADHAVARDLLKAAAEATQILGPPPVPVADGPAPAYATS